MTGALINPDYPIEDLLSKREISSILWSRMYSEAEIYWCGEALPIRLKGIRKPIKFGQENTYNTNLRIKKKYYSNDEAQDSMHNLRAKRKKGKLIFRYKTGSVILQAVLAYCVGFAVAKSGATLVLDFEFVGPVYHKEI